MASLDAPQIRVLQDSVRDQGEVDTDNETEQTPLLRHAHQRPAVGSRSRPRRSCCVKSKAAVAILCWNFLIAFVIEYPMQFIFLAYYSDSLIPGLNLQEYIPTLYGLFALLYLFYPLAGCLADVKCGRYKTIIRSLWFITVSGLFVTITSSIITYLWYKLHFDISAIISIIIVVAAVIAIIMVISGYISFNANVIQFGMDQLYDSPSEDSVLFVHWFVFIIYMAHTVNRAVVSVMSFADTYKIASKIRRKNKTLAYTLCVVAMYATPMVLLIVIGISSWIVHKYKRHWFMINQASRNPYKLVYKVIKFAAQHKTPIRRSAFTYCEDELPSRMDLGKDKYGGPFTTEQVEDVKAFLGIMALQLTLGPMLATDIAGRNMLIRFSFHLREQVHNYRHVRVLLEMLITGGLTELLIVISIPLYVCLLRPFIHRYIPGMLKRIGLGIFTRLLSLLSIILIDTAGHIEMSTSSCFIQYDYHSLNISWWYLTIPNILNALSSMLFEVAVFEFMCAQSPHAMKGLIIGTYFAIQGTFQFLGATVLYVPFFFWSLDTSFPSCGFVYYLINILVALSGLVAYTCVARRYQYRQRDEPDNVYRYAEDYYDRAIDERPQNSYDYSNDIDNLNVHTVDK